jgi:hypothetical protein
MSTPTTSNPLMKAASNCANRNWLVFPLHNIVPGQMLLQPS